MKLLPAVLIVSLMLFTLVASSQELLSSGARNQSLAGASVGLTGCWSVYGNQAGLAQISRTEIGGSFHSRFLVSELSTRSGILVFPVQSSVFALSFSQFGKNPFRQEMLGLSYAQQIFPRFNFGLQFNYYRIFMSEDNRSTGAAGFELGMQYLFPDRLTLGVHVLNPYQTGIKTGSGIYRFPSRLNWGASLLLSDSFGISTELEHDFEHHLIVRSGMEYAILEKFFVRAGFSGKPYQLSAGIGFQAKKLSIDIASSYHQYLGDSPALSFQYQF